MKAFGILFVVTALSGCANSSSPQQAKSDPPAKLAGPAVKEADLVTVTLTPEAEQRVGIRVEEARAGSRSEVRQFTGEITAPPGSSIVVSSSVAGTLQAAPGGVPAVGAFVKQDQPLFSLTPFIPLSRDLRVAAEGDVIQARTRLETAQQRKARADRMLADEVGTIRAQEEAQQEVAMAATALQAAENRLREVRQASPDVDYQIAVKSPRQGILRQVLAAPGQALSAGAPIFEVADLDEVWIRVPVYSGEAATLATNTAVSVQALNSAGRSWSAEPVAAPPSADPSSSTVHLYYRLANSGLRFKPGEKLLVTFRAGVARERVDVPWSSIVFDTHGGSWLYESLGDRRYARRRVDLDHSASGRAFLNAGIRAGTPVVAEGVAELWGFEFGTGK